ncbi:MAG: repressor LexA [Planctomycetes bacterium]|nr:repressor LexA [Planctomycetota bacterium]
MNRKNPNQITPRQLEVLSVIAEFEDRQCYSATIAEIAGQLSVSRTTVFEHIAALRRKKLLTNSRGKARSSRITRLGRQLLDEKQQKNAMHEMSPGIPLLGRVAAGYAIEAIENRDTLSLADLFGNMDDIFSLQVTGESMIDAGISDGDYVICRRAVGAHNGQIVVAILDENEVTVKKFYLEPDHIRLEPANKAFQPIYSQNCRIEAIVIGLLHSFR